MARPKKEKTLGTRVTDEMLARVDRIATECGVARSDVVSAGLGLIVEKIEKHGPKAIARIRQNLGVGRGG